jgi:hypothetical protein
MTVSDAFGSSALTMSELFMNEIVFIAVSSIVGVFLTAGISIAVLKATDHAVLTIVSGSLFAMAAYVAACVYLKRRDDASILNSIASTHWTDSQKLAATHKDD